MKNFTIAVLAMVTFDLCAQIRVHTTPPSAMLDVTSTTDGFLIPRIALTAANVQAPVVNPQGGALAVSTMVYNTATVAGANGVSPGFYYWNGTRWVGLSEPVTNDWSVAGNDSTTSPAIPATYGISTIGATENYLGTADANDLVFATNLTERLRLARTT